jgi:hypothetical protein
VNSYGVAQAWIDNGEFTNGFSGTFECEMITLSKYLELSNKDELELVLAWFALEIKFLLLFVFCQFSNFCQPLSKLTVVQDEFLIGEYLHQPPFSFFTFESLYHVSFVSR